MTSLLPDVCDLQLCAQPCVDRATLSAMGTRLYGLILSDDARAEQAEATLADLIALMEERGLFTATDCERIFGAVARPACPPTWDAVLRHVRAGRNAVAATGRARASARASSLVYAARHRQVAITMALGLLPPKPDGLAVTFIDEQNGRCGDVLAVRSRPRVLMIVVVGRSGRQAADAGLALSVSMADGAPEGSLALALLARTVGTWLPAPLMEDFDNVVFRPLLRNCG